MQLHTPSFSTKKKYSKRIYLFDFLFISIFKVYIRVWLIKICTKLSTTGNSANFCQLKDTSVLKCCQLEDTWSVLKYSKYELCLIKFDKNELSKFVAELFCLFFLDTYLLIFICYLLYVVWYVWTVFKNKISWVRHCV